MYARVPAGTPADITRAADAAEAAFPSWSKMGAFERREIFLRAADAMAKRGEEAITALARVQERPGVISRDLGAALDVVSRVRSGIIHINDQGIADEPMPPSAA